MNPPERPERVGLVIVTYNSIEHIDSCLASVMDQRSDRPLTIVVVDSRSTDGSAEHVAHRWPGVTVKVLEDNAGFGSGVNSVLLSPEFGDVSTWVLLNPDAVFTSPDDLQGLIEGFTDPSIGTVSATVLFSHRIESCSVDWVPETGRDGVVADPYLISLTSDGVAPELVAGNLGLLGLDRFGRRQLEWKAPFTSAGDPVTKWAALSRGTIALGNGELLVTTTLEPGSTTEIVVPRAALRVVDFVNSEGGYVFSEGAGDNGFMSIFEPRTEAYLPCQSWSGCCVAIRSEYFHSLRGFDPSFFLYYEDADLAMRGAASGWRYVVATRVLVRHLHSASSNELGASRRWQVVERSRGQFLARHSTPTAQARSVATSALLAARVAVPGVLRRLLKRPGVSGSIIRDRALESRALITGLMVGNRSRLFGRFGSRSRW